MREKDYYGAIKGFCLKWNLPEVWNSDRITGANLIYEVIKVINAMLIELREYEDRVDGKLEDMLKMIEDFLKMFNEDLNETVLNIILEWKDSGELEEIINDALFNQKLDKSVFESFKETYDQTIVDINNKIQSNLNQINENKTTAKDYTDQMGNDLTTFINNLYNIEKIKKVERFLYGEGVGVFAHRGLSKSAPENSNHSFDQAGLNGSYGIELDLQKTLDDGFIVSHDDNTISMTDTNLLISNSGLDTVRNLAVTKGSNVNLYGTTGMLTFQEALFIAKRYNMKVLAELKTKNLNNDQIGKLIKIITDMDMIENVALMSFEFEFIEKVRELNKDIIVGFVQNDYNFGQSSINLVKELMPSFMSVSHTSVNSTIANNRLAINNQMPTTYWTLNNFPDFQTLLKNGIRSITSDNIIGTIPKIVTKSFKIKKVGNTFKLDSRFNAEVCDFEITGMGVNLIYAVPFTYNGTDPTDLRRGVISISPSGDGINSEYTLSAVGGSPSNITLVAINKVTGAGGSISQIPDNSFFNVIITAYNFVGR